MKKKNIINWAWTTKLVCKNKIFIFKKVISLVYFFFRYQSIRRTINQHRPEPEPPTADSTSSGGSDNSPQTSAQARVPPPPTMPVPPIPPPMLPDQDDGRPPAIKFLLRADFFPLLQQNDVSPIEFVILVKIECNWNFILQILELMKYCWSR